jgi:hypothetical protein
VKGYHEQNYPVSLSVRVRWNDGLVHEDEVKGLNPGHALSLAWDNWIDAESITAIAAYKTDNPGFAIALGNIQECRK